MKLLVTGFAPFGESPLNASWEAVRLLPPRLAGAELVTLQLSTSFVECFAELKVALARESPNVVLCVGEAGGRTGLTPERVALNWDDARLADNLGNQPIDRPILPEAPPAYFSRLPVRDLVDAVTAEGLPASVSYSAGTFVCNHLMFQLEHLCASERPDLLAGFVHVPVLDVLDSAATTRGLAAMLRILVSF